MHRFLTILFLCFLSSSSLFGQRTDQKVQWLKDNSHALSNIDPAKHGDGELDFLKSLIGDKRIVFLGEESHHDGSCLQAKSKVIKYLHEQMDFEVLLLEKGFYEVDRAWRDLLEEKDTTLAIFANLMDLFGYSVSSHYMDLYQHIGKQAKGPRPLRIGGIDIIESSPYVWGFDQELRQLLQSLFPNFEQSSLHQDYINVTKTYRNTSSITERRLNKKAASYQLLIDTLQQSLIRPKVEEPPISLQLSFMIQSLKSRYHWQEWSRNRPKIKKKKGTVLADYYTLRDQYMAQNLIWLLETFYPNKKIIVSAASYHLSRNVALIQPRPYFLGKDAIPMGQFVWDKYKDDIYSIAFLSYQGMRGLNITIGNFKLGKRKKGGLEHLLHQTGRKYCFLDPRGATANQKWFNKLYANVSFNESYRTDWTKIFDAFFYIDQMRPDEASMVFKKNTSPPYAPLK